MFKVKQISYKTMVLKKDPLEHKKKQGILFSKSLLFNHHISYSIEQSFTAYSRLLIELKKPRKKNIKDFAPSVVTIDCLLIEKITLIVFIRKV